jgi:hypothetical protein
MVGPEAWAIAILWLYATFGVFWLLQWWLGQHLQGLALLLFGKVGAASQLYFYLLAPGVVLHELSHWFFAKLLLVRTGDMALFRPRARTRGAANSSNVKITLGYVEVYRTDPVRQSLIGVAPLIIGVSTLLVISRALGFNVVGTNDSQLLHSLYSFPGDLWHTLGQPFNIIWLYLVFTISNGMLPSQPDRRPWLFGFIVPGFILLLLGTTGHLPTFSVEFQRSIIGLIDTLSLIFAFAALINLGLALLIWLLEVIVSHLKRRRVVYRR